MFRLGGRSVVAAVLAISGVVVVSALPAAATDDYPANLRAAPRDSVTDPWGRDNRECTSFVAWRASQAGTPLPRVITGPNGTTATMAFAREWAATAARIGFVVDTTPSVGSVAAWGAASEGGIGTVGHVAWVTGVNADLTVSVEEYNLRVDGGYDQRQNVRAQSYIHLDPAYRTPTAAAPAVTTPTTLTTPTTATPPTTPISTSSSAFAASLTTGGLRTRPKGVAKGASATFTAALAGARLSWTLSHTKLSGPTAARLAAGKGAPLALCSKCASPAKGTITLSAEQQRLLRAGQAAVELVTSRNPTGELRGSLRLQQTPTTLVAPEGEQPYVTYAPPPTGPPLPTVKNG